VLVKEKQPMEKKEIHGLKCMIIEDNLSVSLAQLTKSIQLILDKVH